MSVLNQLFSRGLQGAKWFMTKLCLVKLGRNLSKIFGSVKTCLTLAISRIELLQNKRDVQLRLMRKEIAEFLQAGQEPIARIRVEHVIREHNTWEAYEILELFCEFVLARVPILESQRNLFASKYGKEFIAAASELRPDTSVNRTIIEKLSVSAPPASLKLKVLKEIAFEYSVRWDSTKTEAEFDKKPEDLLNGPKPIAIQSHPHPRPETRDDPSIVAHSSVSINGKQRDQYLPSPASSFVGPTITESPTRKQNAEAITDNNRNMSAQSSDALERARTAIVAANRASAAARAAAELVNAGKFSSFKLDQQKT
ncbi:hypothetical protein CASFOL_004098 [Castilleja foliolosa]|uniref:IST1 homolog n=1 Tax=Castilleja foliolosa TaxID=1961234 RepID=A0ABD3EJP2_9LAMI